MTTQGEALYHLQQVELAILEQQKKVQAIEAKLSDSQAIQAAKAAITTIETRLKPLQSKQRDLDLQQQSVRTKRTETEQRLYSGLVKNPKELQEMQQEIDALKRRDNDLEDQLLELLMGIEDEQNQLTAAQNLLQQITNAWEHEHQDLLSEKRLLVEQIAQREETRTQALAAVTPENLKLYQTLKPQKGNRPIATLVGDSCSICRIEQTGTFAAEVRKQQSLLKCRSCGRILVYTKGK